jgi:Flp pilus assembly pilin Flp
LYGSGGLKDGASVDLIISYCKRLIKDEAGGEVLEYALVAGLIIVAALSVIGQVGSKVLAKWTSLNSRI